MGSVEKPFRIACVAPGTRMPRELAKRAEDLVFETYAGKVELEFHPQCFLTSGHFAGDDASRIRALVEVANDPEFDAVWFARGGYGSCRVAEQAIARLDEGARAKAYLGYSDTGFLLAGLHKSGFKNVAHGPMPVDVIRGPEGEAAAKRSLAWLVEHSKASLEKSIKPGQKTMAFNLTILSQMLGTPLEPDFTGHILMLEDVGEYMYRIDRYFFHVTSNENIRKCAGIRLGRCSAVPKNDPDFGMNEEEVARFWCEKSGIAYLGRAEIGHDSENMVVPFS